MTKIREIAISGDDLTFYFDDSDEPWGIDEFDQGTRTRDGLEKIEAMIIDFNNMPEKPFDPMAMRSESRSTGEWWVIVEEGGMHDEDGPYEIDPSIVPEYAGVDKTDYPYLEALAYELTRSFDGRYVVISNTEFARLKNK